MNRLLLTVAMIVLPPAPDGERIDTAASAATQAERLEPPAPPPPPALTFSPNSEGNVCIGAIPWLTAFSPGWDPTRMARYMYRESRCDPSVHNSAGAQGLLQITRINYPYLSRELGVQVTDVWLREPINNIRAAAKLWLYWQRQGTPYMPWTCCT